MRGQPLRPFHGIPLSFKDLTVTAGIRTTFGSKVFEHNVPTEDAIVVDRVRRVGGIVLGKTNTPEFGCKGVTDNRLFGYTATLGSSTELQAALAVGRRQRWQRAWGR
jgi:Asp-tRNA(Asn)/Glu-tRNA(Gln) amidotransferase A subunit family amidase